MPDIIGPRELSLKEKLKAAIQGDSKPGSVREHLANGLANLSEFTPLGVAYAKQNFESSANRGDIPGAVSAMAGMIPGPEGKGMSAALEALHPLEKEALGLAMKMHGSTEPTAENILEAAQYARRAINPRQTQLIDSAVAKLFPENQYREGTALSKEHLDQLSNRGATSVGEDMARRPGSYQRDKMLESHIEDIQDRSELRKPLPPGTRTQDGDNITPADELRLSLQEGPHSAAGYEEDLAKIAGGDPHKENFIRNAMDDEGGNVPEDVAMTLVDHALQKDPKRLKQLLDDHEITSSRSQYGTEANEQSLGELTQSLAQNHSIPEMLAMHYDLDPERFKNVYEMPSTRPKSRPTQ